RATTRAPTRTPASISAWSRMSAPRRSWTATSWSSRITAVSACCATCSDRCTRCGPTPWPTPPRCSSRRNARPCGRSCPRRWPSSRPPSPEPSSSSLRDRRAEGGAFRWLWGAHTGSVFGSLVDRTALPVTAIIVLDASPLDMALLSVADLAASLVTSVLVAPWVDRVRRLGLMLGADLGRAVALGLVPLAAVQGWLRLDLLYAIALVAGAL